MLLPTGAQTQIARETGLSRQAVSRVLRGDFRNDAVLSRAAELSAAYARKIRLAQFRVFLASLTDEQLTAFLP